MTLLTFLATFVRDLSAFESSNREAMRGTESIDRKWGTSQTTGLAQSNLWRVLSSLHPNDSQRRFISYQKQKLQSNIALQMLKELPHHLTTSSANPQILLFSVAYRIIMEWTRFM